ncbi:MAG: hypothetical protein GY841_04520 [FCB group bacterium]|nr:hypothetical protein [FCB group bacterium]
MSTYAGQNLFGSGPHRITTQPETFVNKFSGYAGLNGAEVLMMGGRGRRIRITGQLKAATFAALDTILANIETYRRLGPATLVDNDAAVWPRVVLNQIQIVGHKKYTSTGIFVQYTLSAVQL